MPTFILQPWFYCTLIAQQPVWFDLIHQSNVTIIKTDHFASWAVKCLVMFVCWGLDDMNADDTNSFYSWYSRCVSLVDAFLLNKNNNWWHYMQVWFCLFNIQFSACRTVLSVLAFLFSVFFSTTLNFSES